MRGCISGKMTDMAESDYKYILESLSTIQVGARYTFAELQDNVDFSYKFRCIIKRTFLAEVAPDTTLESHLYYMKPEDESCEILTLIKSKIRLYVPRQKKGRGGRTVTEYEERVLTPKELSSISPEQKKAMGMMIFELQINKLGLMSYAIG